MNDASSRSGEVIAGHLSARGVAVVVGARRMDRPATPVASVEAKPAERRRNRGRGWGHPIRDDVRLAATALDRFDGRDVLVRNAEIDAPSLVADLIDSCRLRRIALRAS